jgi:hypothetical protein
MSVSRRSLLGGIGGAAVGTVLLGGLGLDPPAAEAAGVSSGPYGLANGYISLGGSDGILTELAFDPSGKGSYGANLLAASGLYFQLTSDGATTVLRSPATTWTATADQLVLTIPLELAAVDNIVQDEVNAGSVISADGGVVQTFTTPAADYALTEIGLSLFAASGEPFPTSGVTVTVLEGPPGSHQTTVYTTEVTPEDLRNGVVGSGPALTTYLSVPAVALAPSTVYSLQLTSDDPYWAFRLQTSPVFSGGTFYVNDGATPTNWAMTFSVQLTAPAAVAEYTGVWTISLDGPALQSDLVLQADEAHQVSATGFEFSTAWVYGGYDVNDPTTAPFRRFFGSDGQYFPIQVFKRRPSMTGGVAFEAPGIDWIYFTGQQGYDLRFAWPEMLLQFMMASSTMTYSFGPGPTTSVSAGESLTFPFNFTVLPHSDSVPAWYPVFSSSDSLVDTYLSEFYWERAFEWVPGLGQPATDWLYWMALELDWQGGPLREGQRVKLESIPLTSDGYVWTENPGEGWAFPSPPYDNRHFTTNAMYILAIAQYYAWTGDEGFLSRMLAKAELAMQYYLDQLGGSSGLCTIDRGFIGTTGLYAHTAEDGAPGTNYWDLCSYGWKDAYVNLYFVGALAALAELEFAAGNGERGRELVRLRAKARRAYNQTFFREVVLPDGRRAGRFVQSIDRRGVVHDHGATYLNLEAMSFGIPWRSSGRKILDWLDHGRTMLTETRVLLQNNAPGVTVAPGATAAQSFLATGEFTHVSVQVTTNGNDDSAMTVSVYAGPYPNGRLVTSRRYVGVWPEGFNNVIEVPVQPAGYYYVTVSETSGPIVWSGSSTPYGDGAAYLDGSQLTSPANFSISVVSPHQDGPEDIYSAWGWAPRTTTHKNNFNYVFLWVGVTVPWGVQLEDGGADLYEVGFDVMARARYSSGDDAYARMKAVLERFSLPDRLCGGPPLYLGEEPEDEVQAGAVGVDVPFPESGVAPASFLHGILGVRATPTRLEIRPALPSTMDWAQVTNVAWRGHVLTIRVDRHHVDVEGFAGGTERHAYRPGQRVVLKTTAGDVPTPA